jgi:hypothetical protein
MRDPPLTTIEAVEGVRLQRGEPPMARVSISRLADMHEAMDVEEEVARRAEAAAKARAAAKRERH